MYKIEILTKTGFKNIRGNRVADDIKGMGIKNLKKVEYSPLYIIDSEISMEEVKKIADELLSDKITESATIIEFNPEIEQKKQKTSALIIEVWYKKGVTDTVSESVVKAVKDLGINQEIKVSTGHKYYIYGGISSAVLSSIATKLLANTLIQEYKIN